MSELLREDSPITLVELRPRSFGHLYGSEPPDVYGIAKFPTRAIQYLHAVAKEAGFNNVESIAPAFNPGSSITRKGQGRLSKDNWSRCKGSKVVGASAISRTVDVSLEFLAECKKEDPEIVTVIGGHHPTFNPEYCLERGVDIVVRGEGDKTFPMLLRQMVDKGTYEGIPGTSIRKGDKIIHEDPCPLLTKEELAKLPLPIYAKGVLEGQDVCVMHAGRGCPSWCKFCAVSKFYEGKYRRRPNKAIAEEWAMFPPHKRMFWADDNFAADKEKTKELLEEGIRRGLTQRNIAVQVRAKVAADRELLRLFKRAGISTVCVGFESQSEETLELFDKQTTAEENEAAAAAFLEEEIDVLGMFILGADGDTSDSVDKLVDWSIKNVKASQFFALQPLVGTEETARLSAEGRILAAKYHTLPKYYLYDGYHVHFEPVHFSPYGLQRVVIDAYRKFYSFKRLKWDLADFGNRVYAALTIPRILRDPQTMEHINFLKSLESPRYF